MFSDERSNYVTKVRKDLQQIVGQNISRVWTGYGSGLFLELGEVHNELAWDKGGKPISSATGEWMLSSEGAWKVLKNGSVLFNAEAMSTSRTIKFIKKLNGLQIISLKMTEDLEILLSDKSYLIFHKADYGFFTLISNIKTFISYEQNSLYIQSAVL